MFAIVAGMQFILAGCAQVASALYLAPALCCAQMLQSLWREGGSNARQQREEICAHATIPGRSEANTVRCIVSVVTAGSTSSLK